MLMDTLMMSVPSNCAAPGRVTLLTGPPIRTERSAAKVRQADFPVLAVRSQLMLDFNAEVARLAFACRHPCRILPRRPTGSLVAHMRGLTPSPIASHVVRVGARTTPVVPD